MKRLERFRGLAALPLLVSLLAGFPGVAGAQQVNLPLTQYEELRARANPAPDTLVAPAAPFALELADFDVTAGPVSARVAQRLRLTLYDDKWQTVPLGDPGSFIHADLAGVEGRVDASDKGWVLHVRGRGRHEVRLDSAVPVLHDETSTRPLWRFGLRLPPAAVVRGVIAVPAAVEEVEIDGAGQMSPQEGKAAGKPWSFVATPGADAHWTLSGRATLPARAQLPLRWEATSVTAVALSRTRLRVIGWIEAGSRRGHLRRRGGADGRAARRLRDPAAAAPGQRPHGGLRQGRAEGRRNPQPGRARLAAGGDRRRCGASAGLAEVGRGQAVRRGRCGGSGRPAGAAARGLSRHFHVPSAICKHHVERLASARRSRPSARRCWRPRSTACWWTW